MQSLKTTDADQLTATKICLFFFSNKILVGSFQLQVVISIIKHYYNCALYDTNHAYFNYNYRLLPQTLYAIAGLEI